LFLNDLEILWLDFITTYMYTYIYKLHINTWLNNLCKVYHVSRYIKKIDNHLYF